MADINLVQCVFDRGRLWADEDVAVVTMHIRAVIPAAPDDLFPISDSERNNFASRWLGFWHTWQPHVPSDVMHTEMRFYDLPSSPGVDMGPPVMVTPINELGTGTDAACPPQVSVSVTWKTDARKTWGRFYLPHPNVQVLTGAGSLAPAIADQLAAQAATLADRGGAGAALTVFSRKQWTHHDPQSVQVDDLMDVIRKRRYSKPHHRAQVQI